MTIIWLLYKIHSQKTEKMELEKKSLTVEKFLQANGANLFLDNYLRFFYDEIDNNTLKVIIAPTDDGLDSLQTIGGQYIEQLISSDEVINVLANGLSIENLNPTAEIAYRSINNLNIPTEYLAELRIVNSIIIEDSTRVKLTVMVIDDTMYVGGQLDEITALGKINYENSSPKTIEETTVAMIQQAATYENMSNDVLRKIALNLSLKDLVSNCRLSKKFNIVICSNELFWNEKVRKDFPEQTLLVNNSFKQTYRFLMRDLYCFGRNTIGQLGLGDTRPRYTPELVEDIRGVSMVACGASHTAIIANNKLYTAGSNLFGQLGRNISEIRPRFGTLNFSSNFTLVPGVENVSYVACGYAHTAVVSNGNLYTFGNNDHGQLGVEDIQISDVPVFVKELGNVSMVACGYAHTIALSGGRMYSFGDNGDARLGPGIGTRRRTTPTLIKSPQNVSFVACGGNHSAAISNGELYMFGDSRYYQLGMGTGNMQEAIPKLVASPGGGRDKTLENVTHVACGSRHTAVIAGGRLYTFGNNEMGQLGLGTNTTAKYPTLVETPTPVKFVACGENHTAIICDGMVYTFGEGGHGELGHGEKEDENNKYIPTVVDYIYDADYIACGYGFTCAIDSP